MAVGRDLLVVLKSPTLVRDLKPDFERIKSLPDSIFAVIVTAQGNEDMALKDGRVPDFVTRFFAPAKGVDEDPVTGSAHCALTPYWSERLMSPLSGSAHNYFISHQYSFRGVGEVRCRTADGRVFMAGHCASFIEGKCFVPEDLSAD